MFAIALVLDLGSTFCMAMVWISGSITPAPRPWRMRKATRDSAFHAQAQRMDPRTNTQSANSHSRLPPTRACAQLTKGIAIARASR